MQRYLDIRNEIDYTKIKDKEKNYEYRNKVF